MTPAVKESEVRGLRRSPSGPIVFGLAVGVVLIVPVVVFALYTRATIDSDISVRLREDREAAARQAAAMVRQRLEGATADLARFVRRPDVADAARRRDAQALEVLLTGLADPHQFRNIGVVDAHGEVVARVPAGSVDPTFATDVAANVSGGSDPFMSPDARAPFGIGSVGAVILPLETGAERLAVYGMLSFEYFRSVLAPVSLLPGRSMVLLDEHGRGIVASDSSGDPLFVADVAYYTSTYSTASGYVGRPFEIPGRQQALAIDFGSETLTFDGRERLAIHVAVLPGHWVLYMLDTPAIALAGERRLTQQVTVGAGIAAAVAASLAVVIAVLIGRLRRHRQQLEIANADLAAASKHKTEFMANMSHELRTPLNAIIGFSDVLEQRLFGELNEKQVDYTRDIASSGRHLLDLVNEILDLSKVEAGRMELDRTEFALAETIRAALAFVRERAAGHRIELTAPLPEDLGTVVADERKVRQVLLNLLSNAVKFTPDGGRVAVHARRSDDEIQVSVQDTGIGIAPEDQPRVFEEFRQVGKTSDRSREGTGLGLTLAKRLIELHGGRIWIDSVVGKGTTFTFTIPVGRAASA